SEIHGGTRFSVIFPTSSTPAKEVERPARPAAVQQTMLEGLRVLCIDNDPRILDGMRRLLEGWGCAVSTATGSATLPDFSGGAPNIILADYHLDNEVGLDVIAALRARYGETIPAILITADRSNEVRAEAEALTAMVLNKPLRPASLRTLLMRCRQMLAAAE
ncbi:MAG: response regulator, partial [Nitratireductor sp.]